MRTYVTFFDANGNTDVTGSCARNSEVKLIFVVSKQNNGWSRLSLTNIGVAMEGVGVGWTFNF